MCLPPQDDVAHESARRKRVAPSTAAAATSTAAASAVVASPLPAARHIPSRIVHRHEACAATSSAPRVAVQEARIVHVIPTALSQLCQQEEASSAAAGDNDKLSLCPPNTTATAATAATLQDCRCQLWHNRNKIQDFRLQAQTIAQRLRGGQTTLAKSVNHDNSDDDDDDKDEDEDEETRGLKARMSFQRQDRKQMIARRILSAQNNQGVSP